MSHRRKFVAVLIMTSWLRSQNGAMDETRYVTYSLSTTYIRFGSKPLPQKSKTRDMRMWVPTGASYKSNAPYFD